MSTNPLLLHEQADNHAWSGAPKTLYYRTLADTVEHLRADQKAPAA